MEVSRKKVHEVKGHVKIFSDGKGTILLRGKKWQVKETKREVAFIAFGWLYVWPFDALFEMELEPKDLDEIDVTWRRVTNAYISDRASAKVEFLRNE